MNNNNNNNYDWVEEEHIPSLVDSCVAEIKDYVEHDGKAKYQSMERMFRIKKFDVATSSKAIDKAIELGIMDQDKYLYEGY